MELLNKKYKTIVAEGPLWDDREQKLLYVDILGCCIFKYDLTTDEIEKIDVGQQIGCMALCENGDLLLAMQDGIYRMDKQGNKTLAHQPIPIKGRRFNDGKIGPDGCFYLGTTDADGEGAFYRLRDGELVELFDKCNCSNGLDWTVDETKMYYCDTPLRKIELFDFNSEKNELTNRRTFIDIPAELGNPDGFSMDADDNIWLGLWDGSAVVKIDTAEKKIVETIPVPARKASCTAFAGKGLDILVVTTASKGDEETHPEAGYVFSHKTNVTGKAPYRYKY
ncbi:MAG: SMP-30/gluconolactonase/LRE family protein [Clostridia bacterium]|nr:SMP-30/gluconolactonase/LRE family protein [Clostridia bacterium]